MEQKFFLNKFVKISNIESYTLSSLKCISEAYDNMLEKAEGKDPDFPEIEFEGKKGTKVKGISTYQADQMFGKRTDSALSAFDI